LTSDFRFVCVIAERFHCSNAIGMQLAPSERRDEPGYVFQDSSTCSGAIPTRFEQWNRSAMTHTNRNRWVNDLYNGTDATMPFGPAPDPRNPPYYGFLARHNVDPANPTRQGECANCHQPEYVGRTRPTRASTHSPARIGAASRATSATKVVDVDVSPEGITRPNLVVGQLGLPAKTTMLRSTTEPWLAFGPLDDVTFPGVPPCARRTPR